MGEPAGRLVTTVLLTALLPLPLGLLSCSWWRGLQRAEAMADLGPDQEAIRLELRGARWRAGFTLVAAVITTVGIWNCYFVDASPAFGTLPIFLSFW